ncbi:hypothetical protein [Burkholderia ambifaria]|uniref:Uncharacterized protein n=1 Tax=Burkholderia ambifaria MEX-5 TaxID=396597 RepID=B1T0Q3_9BURK|nr:hypothetical protein [Burkholderia ambifaria]EDT42878.1 hypothetical protein BamMEX5DRAFT_1369 [Burkholderia ambifaria MEX-5]
MFHIRRPPIRQSRARGTGAARAKLQDLTVQFRAAMTLRDYLLALKLARHALGHTPGNMTILGEHAPCLMRTGAYEEAYRAYRQILDAPPAQRAHASDTWLDCLGEVCG